MVSIQVRVLYRSLIKREPRVTACIFIMLYVSDRQTLDATYQALEKSRKNVFERNRKKRNALTKQAAEEFVNKFQAENFGLFTFEGLTGVEAYKPTTYTAADSERAISFEYEGNQVTGLRASVGVGVGSLAYTLKFYECQGWTDDTDWVTHRGTLRVTPVVSADLVAGTTQVVEQGVFQSYQSLADNLGGFTNQLNRAMKGIKEHSLSEELRDTYFKDYNEAQERYHDDMRTMNRIVEDHDFEKRCAINTAAGILADSVNEMLENGVSVKDLKNFYAGQDFALKTDTRKRLIRDKYYANNTLTRLVRYCDDSDVITIKAPKRSNSKQRFGEVTTAEGEYKRYIEVDRQDFARELRYACEHIAVANEFNLDETTECHTI